MVYVWLELGLYDCMLPPIVFIEFLTHETHPSLFQMRTSPAKFTLGVWGQHLRGKFFIFLFLSIYIFGYNMLE